MNSSQPATDNSQLISALLKELGADVFGIAHMARYDREVFGLEEGVSSRYPYAISFGLLLSKGLLETVTDGPTLLYQHHYRQANYRLDIIAYEAAKRIEGMGHKALPLAASQMIDWQNQRGHISHKHIGVLAGMGWIGRNNLLVHPIYGSRLRYNTVLTDMALVPDEPVQFGCGHCAACVAVCPASAIKERPEEFDHHGCYEALRTFKNKRNLGHHICGLCVKTCGGKR
jgi:epoxyqueuosine reductase